MGFNSGFKGLNTTQPNTEFNKKGNVHMKKHRGTFA